VGLDDPELNRLLQGMPIFNEKNRAVGMYIRTPGTLGRVAPWKEIVSSSPILQRFDRGSMIEEIIAPGPPLPPSPSSPFHHPFAAFERITQAGVVEEIPPTSALPARAALQFVFGFSSGPKGIPFQGEQPVLAKPTDEIYPIGIQVVVWSEEIHFKETSAQLSLVAPDVEARAIFPLDEKPITQGKKQGSVFVFVRHEEKHLIGVFRVIVALEEPAQLQQRIDSVYLDNRWFRFAKHELTAPALTIYFRAAGETVDLFTLGEKLWATTGIPVSGIRGTTNAIYLAVTKRAVAIADPNVAGNPMTDQIAANQLAQLGANLFSNLFFADGASPLIELGERISGLPEGSQVTIAADLESDRLILPWGFIYDGRPPEDERSGITARDKFWGRRFQLVIRPSLKPETAAPPARGSADLVMGSLYEMPEAAKIAAYVEGLKQRKVVQLTDITIDKAWLPLLAKQPFDLLHFLCHGCTEISDVLLLNALQGVTRGSPLQYFESSAKQVYLHTRFGDATLAELQRQIKELPSSPVVLLSMCHSAQVSSSGQSFVVFFLNRGARAVVGTEGPNPFEFAAEMDEGIIERLLSPQSRMSLSAAVWQTRKTKIDENILALIYTVYGDGHATLAAP
jgi:hypothetical protein